jgi:hypothetical protein
MESSSALPGFGEKNTILENEAVVIRPADS